MSGVALTINWFLGAKKQWGTSWYFVNKMKKYIFYLKKWKRDMNL